MRDSIWRWFRHFYVEGELLPPWMVIIRAALFPLDTLYWKLSKARGYQLESDTWLIHGVRYSDEALRLLARSVGEIYRIERTADVVTLYRIKHGGYTNPPSEVLGLVRPAPPPPPPKKSRWR